MPTFRGAANFFEGDYNNVRGNINKNYNGNYYDLRGSPSPHNVDSFNRSQTVIIDSFNNDDDHYGSGNPHPQQRRKHPYGHVSNPTISGRDSRKRPQYPEEHIDGAYEQYPPVPPHPPPRGWTSPGPQRPHKPRHVPLQNPIKQWSDDEHADEQGPMYTNPGGFQVPHRQNNHKGTTIDFDSVYGGGEAQPTPPHAPRRAETRPVQQRLPHSDPIIAPVPGAHARKASKNPFHQFYNANVHPEASLTRDMDCLTVREQPIYQDGGALVSEPGEFSSRSASSRTPRSFMHANGRSPARQDTSSSLVPEPTKTLDDSTASAIALRITSVISDKTSYQKLLHAEWSRAQRLVDISQAVLESPAIEAKPRRELVVSIQRFAKRVGVYPRSYNLEGVKKTGFGFYAEGAYGTVHRGFYQNRNVCLKVLKQDGRTMNLHLSKAVAREAIVWRQLDHRNILPFYGICELEIGLCMVSPWMRGGNLPEYVRGPVNATERLLVARDVAEGLKYLHSFEIVHGDLKGKNVLIDGVGRARIADFGLTSINDPTIEYWASPSRVASRGGNLVFQAPELLERDDVDNSKASDMYAWGCVCYELYVGEEPYKGHKTDIMKRKLRNELPKCPEENSIVWTERGLTRTIWSLMLQAWSTQPDRRPDSSKIVKRLLEMIVEDPRQFEEDEQEPEAEFIRRWCRGRPEDDPVSSGMRQKFNIPTLKEVDKLLGLR